MSLPISKILNNNVVVIQFENNIEKIYMGKGIGYKKKVGDLLDESVVEKEFSLSSPDMSQKLQELIADIPIEYIDLSEEIITMVKIELGKKISDTIFVSLIDHIYTAVIRLEQGITMRNALIWDIKQFYPDEFTLGKQALEIIKQKINIELPIDEAGFIALHIINAELDENLDDIYEITKLMQEISNIVKYSFNIEFDEESVFYYRFITHLKFFSQRVINKKQFEDREDELLKIIKEKYQNAYQCVKKIQQFIHKKYQYELSNEEKMYLTIHIERLVYKTKS